MNNARLHLDKCLTLSIYEQLQITSINQAKRLGQFDRKGTIQAGKDTDIVVVGQDGEVELTTFRGVIAFESNYAKAYLIVWEGNYNK